MRLDDYRTSDNVEDQRGQSFGGGGMNLGGGLPGLLFGLMLSRFGLGGVIVLLIGMMLFGMNPLSLLGGGGGQMAPRAVQTNGRSAEQACAVDAESKFSCQVLANTEDTWSAILAQQGQRYTPAGLRFYGGTGQSGCGIAQSAMGPFYCPSDNRIYLDTEFFNELQNKYHAAGDFAQAYVIAHEVGHHVQFLTGTLQKAQEMQTRASTAEGNAIQVRVELQADCLAGVWAAHNRDRLDPGDVEEGMRAASAVGDDTLQRETQGRVVPESFTHGSAEQRMHWLKVGLDSGDPAQCDTFSGTV